MSRNTWLTAGAIVVIILLVAIREGKVDISTGPNERLLPKIELVATNSTNIASNIVTNINIDTNAPIVTNITESVESNEVNSASSIRTARIDREIAKNQEYLRRHRDEGKDLYSRSDSLAFFL